MLRVGSVQMRYMAAWGGLGETIKRGWRIFIDILDLRWVMDLGLDSGIMVCWQVQQGTFPMVYRL